MDREQGWDLFAILEASGSHGSLRVAVLPNSAEGVTRLLLIDRNDGQHLASFWLFGNVFVRFAMAPGKPRESHWVLTPGQLDRLRGIIAGLDVQYNQG